MEAIAKSKFQRYGATKVAQVLDHIRGKTIRQAEQVLPMIPRRAVKLVEKTLRSAVANLNVKAGRKVEPEKMYVKAAWVGQGPMSQLKRVLPAPQGRAMTFKRKMCHLTMIVSDERGKGV